MYAPDICDSKEKFVVATTKDELKKKIQPFNKEFQINDWADLDQESFIKILQPWAKSNAWSFCMIDLLHNKVHSTFLYIIYVVFFIY